MLIQLKPKSEWCPGVTTESLRAELVSMVKGFGDYVNNFDPFGFSDHMKVEIYTTQERSESIAAELLALAGRLTEGGGVVAVEPVHRLMNVRKLDE